MSLVGITSAILLAERERQIAKNTEKYNEFEKSGNVACNEEIFEDRLFVGEIHE